MQKNIAKKFLSVCRKSKNKKEANRKLVECRKSKRVAFLGVAGRSSSNPDLAF